VEFRRVRTNGIELSCAVAGQGPLVLLLHGFPEDWRSWEPVIPALVDAGFRVVAPDLRGYGASDAPSDGYDLETLADDVRGVAVHFLQEEGGDGPSGRRVRLVGHDWGGVLTWVFAYRHADLLDRAASLAMSHPLLVARQFLSRQQLRRSWYIVFFQLPRLPEAWLRRGGIAWPWRAWGASPDAIPADVQDVLRASFLRPGALRAPLAWYRTIVRRGPLPLRPYLGRTDVPLLVLWGEEDHCLTDRTLRGLDRVASDLRLVRIPNAGHWLQREATGRVCTELIRFLRPDSGE